MKKQNNPEKKNIFKKIFIKICRFIGYEIIEFNDRNVYSDLSLLNNLSFF